MAKRYNDKMGTGSFANMPQEVVQKDYPKANTFDMEGYEDTMVGIDNQTREDSSQMRKSNKKQNKKF